MALTTFEAAFSVLAVGLLFLMLNPYGALIYVMACLIYTPQTKEEFDMLTYMAIVIMLLSTLINRSRGWKG